MQLGKDVAKYKGSVVGLAAQSKKKCLGLRTITRRKLCNEDFS